ncbi:MAG: VOC family protein [Acidimicrobiia bacterium]
MLLDHVALASRDSLPILNTLVADFGGTVLQGAISAGFRPVQVRVGDAHRGMTVELLEPYDVDKFDFLERFLKARGPGPHHLTFKVHDLAAELDRVRAAGITPTGILLDSPRWKEAFITPAQAHGTVVQLAQGGLDFPTFADQFASARTDGPYGEPRWWPEPPPRAPEPSFLEHVVVSTPSLDAAIAFYTDVLRGTVGERGDGFAAIGWAGGGCVRLEADADRPPGVTRLDVVGPGPAREVVLAGTPLVVRPD